MSEPDSTQLVKGSGLLYIAVLGSTLPTLDAHGEYPIVWPAAWKAVGYTEDGIEAVYTPSIKPLHVDEETAAVDDVLSEEKFHVSVKLSEATLLNYSRVVSASTYTDDSTAASDINVKVGSKALNYVMVGIDCPAPGTNLRRLILIEKAIATGAVGMKIQRKDKVVFPATWDARQISGHQLYQIHDFTSNAS